MDFEGELLDLISERCLADGEQLQQHPELPHCCALLLLATSFPLAVAELPSSYGTKKCFLGLLSLGQFTERSDLPLHVPRALGT